MPIKIFCDACGAEGVGSNSFGLPVRLPADGQSFTEPFEVRVEIRKARQGAGEPGLLMCDECTKKFVVKAVSDWGTGKTGKSRKAAIYESKGVVAPDIVVTKAAPYGNPSSLLPMLRAAGERER
jgi:hypothetical protein